MTFVPGTDSAPEPFDLATAITKVKEAFPPVQETTAYPALILLCGLPGTGKSYLARRLALQLPVVVMETDFVRKTLFSPPTYSAEESSLVHKVARVLTGQFLREGRHVICDATNLREFHRELIYRQAERNNARLVIVRVVAPAEVVRQRLEQRRVARSEGDISDADFAVYKRMCRSQEPILRPHLVVDTAQDFEQGVQKVLRAVRRKSNP
jgi:predicted kinase